MALAAFAKSVGIVFLGAPRSKPAAHAVECGWFMRAPMLVLVTIMIAIGLLPGLFFRPAMGVVAVWAPQWTMTDPLLATRTLGGTHTLLLCALLAGGFLILQIGRAHV